MSNSDEQIFFPETREIKIFNKETKQVETFEISEFVFENRTVFIKFLAEVFKDLVQQIPDVSSLNNTAVMIHLIDIAGEKLGKIYSMVLGKDLEWVKKNLTLSNEVEIVTAILEVNNLPLLMSRIQQTITKLNKKEK